MARGRPCSICNHPRRADLEKRYTQGVAADMIGEEFSCSGRQLLNHFKRGHVRKAIQEARIAQNVELGARAASSVQEAVAAYLNKVNQLLKDCDTVQTNAIAAGEDGITLAAIQKQFVGLQQASRFLELAAKLTGELDQKSYSLYVLPEWSAVVAFLVNVLDPYPEARAAVIQGLRERVQSIHPGRELLEDGSGEESDGTEEDPGDALVQ